MNIKHVSSRDAIGKTVEHPTAFILVNERKDFATMYGTQMSRYEGFFVSNGDTFIKTLSRVVKNSVADSLEIYHDQKIAVRRYGSSMEGYFVIPDEPVLIYKTDEPDTMLVRLDMRDQFHIPEFGRNYEVEVDGNIVVVGYADQYVSKPVYLAVLHDGVFHPLQSWTPIEYERDKQRNSAPTILWEYELGQYHASKLVFAFGTSAKEAIKRARKYAGTHVLGKITSAELKTQSANGLDATSEKLATYCANNALDALFIKDRMLAGKPWFTKAWARDELISMPALPKDRAHKIISKYLKSDWSKGKFPVIFGGENCCSDGLGLLCWGLLYGRYELDEKERSVLSKKLRQATKALSEMENEFGFIPSGERESWMDSLERTGYPVETQALYSKIIHLGELLLDSTEFEKKRRALLKNIHTHYYKDGYLHDRLYDDTMRPNIFLAALFAPELLTRAEWESCFDKILPAIWLEWGGLSSIDKQHCSYCEISVGELDYSYHNGDSWFFVNNIAAAVLSQINSAKYSEYIKGLLSASVEEILWHNYIGMPGEISSARILDSWGCGLQGFSAAAFVLLSEQSPKHRRIFKEILVP